MPSLHALAGWHLERAVRYRHELGQEIAPALARRAAEHLCAAGSRARARSDAAAALRCCQRALAILPEDDPLHTHDRPQPRRTAQRSRSAAPHRRTLGGAESDTSLGHTRRPPGLNGSRAHLRTSARLAGNPRAAFAEPIRVMRPTLAVERRRFPAAVAPGLCAAARARPRQPRTRPRARPRNGSPAVRMPPPRRQLRALLEHRYLALALTELQRLGLQIPDGEIAGVHDPSTSTST